jgi:hypothetical protein
MAGTEDSRRTTKHSSKITPVDAAYAADHVILHQGRQVAYAPHCPNLPYYRRERKISGRAPGRGVRGRIAVDTDKVICIHGVAVTGACPPVRKVVRPSWVITTFARTPSGYRADNWRYSN